MSNGFPARLHVLLARESSKAVVIRRGPSKKVGLFGWDRKTDKITTGQWLKGRIYEFRCDLSPDGKYMIYFAMNGRWDDPVSLGSWTAISRAPYLKALTFIPWGDCWNGGGLFNDNKTYWLNRGCTEINKVRDHWEISEKHDQQSDGNTRSECPDIYYRRLQRDGWLEIGREGDPADWRTPHVTFFEKDLWAHWKIRKSAIADINQPIGRGTYRDEHVLVSQSNEEVPCLDWEWAEQDGKNIIYASEGKLWRQKINSQAKLAEPKLIHDFNKENFEAIEAPY
ncbi:hypothetical protein F9L33_11660 [Amylibacter sp. SFDW26]|uniref:hypothetical protein n=1 Tax=Amylibacter sp. SFDW26 TaxID=2652722 RepID=UPI0012629C9A|nr:hypothetical protein [Amylibacter sp. SFDW26]KAB7613257.1 hypothetical protein F9L33_11660 [Amylibacter sp. SFDW26]